MLTIALLSIFFISGAAKAYYDEGVRYLYVSNGDNLVGLPQPSKAAMLALSGKNFNE